MNIYTISFLIMLVFTVFKNYKYIHMLQHNLYNENNLYFKWVSNNIKDVFISLDILSFIFIIIAYILNNKLSGYLVFIALVFYYLDIVHEINNPKNINIKPLVVTKRVKRLIMTLSILYLLPIIVYLKNRDNGLLLVTIESIIIYLSFIMVLMAKIINKPLEKIVYRLDKEKALQKLDSMKKLKVVGITGSFGKNSCMNIVNDMLNDKYVTRNTVRNLNTEYALTMTINKYLDVYDQIFIASIGTYKENEINKICDFIKPKYGIITYIDLNNVESFYDYKNIIEENFKLIESLPNSGIAILNMDDNNQVTYNIKNNCKKIWIGIDNEKADIRAINIRYDYNGTKFDIIYNGKVYKFETRLLGKYNIYNILASIALGLELDITMDELVKMVKRIHVTKNKLEIKEYDYMYQINDICNTNPNGVKVALDVLYNMPGSKVVVTSGLDNKHLNYMFGNEIAKGNIDKVILIDVDKTRKIFDSLIENGYDKEKIDIVGSVNDAYNLLETFKFTKKMYVLFENNLKDSYNINRKKELR